jgi:alkylhydroperoxidase family enzyme
LLREAAGGDGDFVRRLRDDIQGVPLDASDRALLDFVAKVTFSQQSMEPGDLDVLRGHGFSDLQVLEITAIAGFFNFITRVADALGVESNPERKEWERFLFHG